MINVIIGLVFFVGFTVESAVGLGGTLIAYSFLLFFIDIKPMMVSTIILPIFASTVILLSDVKNVSWKVMIIAIGICLLGMPIGMLLFQYLPSQMVVKALAIFLILFGLKNIFLKESVVKGFKGRIVIFVSGIIHGLIGTGGPVAVIGVKSQLKTKAVVRSTMSLYFIVLNLVRMFQFSLTYEFKEFFIYAWVTIPIFIGILFGHYLHKKISEKHFKLLLSGFFVLCGALLFLR